VVRHQHGDDDDECGGRKDTPRPPGVKSQEARPLGFGPLPDQDPGDHETGNDEEDVHADETAGQRVDPGVEEHH
jgi:hypothetical protein